MTAMEPRLSLAQLLELKSWLTAGTAEAARVKADVSRPELARELGIHESALYRYERGQRTPRNGRQAVDYYRALTFMGIRALETAS